MADLTSAFLAPVLSTVTAAFLLATGRELYRIAEQVNKNAERSQENQQRIDKIAGIIVDKHDMERLRG